MTENNVCRRCGTELTEKNWYPSFKKNNDYICKECKNVYVRQWKKTNPEKVKTSSTRDHRKHGHRPFYENKKCGLYLGVHVAERVLSYVFKNVTRMPIRNHGFDFVCNREKLVDVKSSTLHKNGAWLFNIFHNTVADYFLCLAFDNMENLTPLHAWLLPGSKINHLACATIRPNTLDKWNEYQLDITKVNACCDALR